MCSSIKSGERGEKERVEREIDGGREREGEKKREWERGRERENRLGRQLRAERRQELKQAPGQHNRALCERGERSATERKGEHLIYVCVHSSACL